MSNKNEILTKANLQMLEEFLTAANNPAGVPRYSVPDAYDMTIAQLIEAFGELIANPIMNAVPTNIMYQFAEIITKINLNRNSFTNQILTWMNPQQLRGITADSVAAMKGAFRNPATRTGFVGIARGTPGTIIYASSQIQNIAIQQSEVFVYFNPVEAIIGDNGTVEVAFICENYGAIPLIVGTTFEIKTSIDGWTSIIMTDDISAGSEETTDNELINASDITMYQFSRNGYKAILADITSQMITPSQNNDKSITIANTAINSSQNSAQLPFNESTSNIYSIPSCCIIVSVLWNNYSPINLQKLGQIIFDNIDGANTEHPENVPDIDKTCLKTEIVQVNYDDNQHQYTQSFQFKYVAATETKVIFYIEYLATGAIKPNLNDEIKKAIINTFRNGSGKYPPVTMGKTFLLQQFSDALAPIGLPPYTINMQFANNPIFQTALCSPIWLQPTIEEAAIVINNAQGNT